MCKGTSLSKLWIELQEKKYVRNICIDVDYTLKVSLQSVKNMDFTVAHITNFVTQTIQPANQTWRFQNYTPLQTSFAGEQSLMSLYLTYYTV